MTKPLAVILGAGPGIGMAVALRFAREGFGVAAVARPADPLEAFQEALAAAGAPALVLGADLADPEALEGALAAIQAWGGLPEVLVYNASAGAPGPAGDLDPAQLLRDLQVNAAGPLRAAQWALAGQRRAGRGSLLFTGGGLGLQPKPGMASACLGRAALRSLALSLGAELAPEGIHAATVTVCGFVQPATALDAPKVAQAFWDLHLQPRPQWAHEIIVP
jgi:NAD(P)-dependent dehydrogenase (short-subunit alcohol dehydrogenase family)